MGKKTIDKEGNIEYLNNNGELHRDDGPAIEDANGDKFWFQNGKCHRLDGPAVEYANGNKSWWVDHVFKLGLMIDELGSYWVSKDRKFHNLDKPADWNGSYESWYEKFGNEKD